MPIAHHRVLRSFWLAFASALACANDPEDFNRRIGEILCEKAKNECTPHKFEVSCQAGCELDEDCSPGTCNHYSHVCNDENGEPLDTEMLDAACVDDTDCGGGLLCVQIYEDVDECIDYVEAYWKNFADHCDYNKDYAKQCLEASEERDCDDESPEICQQVYFDCNF